jgi:protein SCO1
MKKSTRFWSFFLGGLFSLFVPLGAYFYLKIGGHTGHVKLPNFYGIDRVEKKQKDGKSFLDTIYHEVAEVKLVNQLGDSVSLNQDLKGKILIINFFFTHCQTICPTLTSNMKLLNKAFKKNDSSIQFLSITVDPELDDIATLRLFANKQNPNHDKWFFLTGSKKIIYDYARHELKLKLADGSGDKNDFIHPDEFVLVDKYRNIRGYYNGLDSDNVRHCAEDASYLMIEKNKLHEISTH